MLFDTLIQSYLAFYEVRVPRDRRFAARFLEIPRHYEYPSTWLATTSDFAVQLAHEQMR